MILWKLMVNVLPSRNLLSSRMGLQDFSCQTCGGEMEDYLHIFKECQLAKILAFASRWGL